MLRPHKHMDLDASVLRTGALILYLLRKRRVLNLESLRARIRVQVTDDTDRVFGGALNLLYALGKIEYYPNNDSLELKVSSKKSSSDDAA
jgi:hypothetical protein